MSERIRYKTKQQKELQAYLKSMQGHHVTVSDICFYMKGKGIAIGTTTVYRQLERLMEAGLVAKYVPDDSGSACFEYIGEGETCHEPVCFHCRCERCGVLIHLSCDELMSVRRHISESHGFVLNPLRTVLYGLCADCRSAGA